VNLQVLVAQWPDRHAIPSGGANGWEVKAGTRALDHPSLPETVLMAYADSQPPIELSWLLPAVPEALVVFDLVEGRIERSKAVPDALDRGSHVHPIAIGATSRDETLIVQPVVDRPVSNVLTRI
jgi:hypothetical protein